MHDHFHHPKEHSNSLNTLPAPQLQLSQPLLMFGTEHTGNALLSSLGNKVFLSWVSKVKMLAELSQVLIALERDELVPFSNRWLNFILVS